MAWLSARVHKQAAGLAAQFMPGQSADLAAEPPARPWDWPTELQAGVLTRSQALAAGLTDKIIAAHLRRGRWQRLQRGVYATFSGTPSRECLLWAAVLRAGPRSVLSHHTAAQLWRLPAAESARIHITMPVGLTGTRGPRRDHALLRARVAGSASGPGAPAHHCRGHGLGPGQQLGLG